MSEQQELNVADLIENDKNKTSVKCTHCDSVILKPAIADYVENEFNLPEPHQKKSQPTAEDGQPAEFACQTLKQFWVVSDMYSFENIGFSRTVNETKYLICADCEIGPVGYFDLQTKRSYVALQRVKHTAG